MQELSLTLGFGWIALGAISAFALLYRRWTLAVALVCGSLTSCLIDFVGGSIAARGFLPVLAMAITHAIVREYRAGRRPPVRVEVAPVTIPADTEPAATKNVLLLRPKTRGSEVWLAHDGKGVVFVTPTSPEQARSGCRVVVRKKSNGELLALT